MVTAASTSCRTPLDSADLGMFPLLVAVLNRDIN